MLPRRYCLELKIFRFQDSFLHIEQSLIPLFWEVSRSSGQGIGFSTLNTWLIANLKVVFRKFLRPARLAAVQGLGSGKIFEIFLIRDYPYRVGGADQVSTPFFVCDDNSEEFFIVDFIVTFCRGNTTTVECNRM